MSLFGLFSIGKTLSSLFKENCESEIPAENWANKELYHKDIMDGVPTEQIMRNVRNGKYKQKPHPEPHRTPDGRIYIENSRLWRQDVDTYGAYQAQKWAEQGKYNLTPEELEEEHKYWEKKMEYIYSLL